MQELCLINTKYAVGIVDIVACLTMNFHTFTFDENISPCIYEATNNKAQNEYHKKMNETCMLITKE